MPAAARPGGYPPAEQFAAKRARLLSTLRRLYQERVGEVLADAGYVEQID